MLALLFCSVTFSAFGQYFAPTGAEPNIRGILYHKKNPRALIYHNGLRYHVTPKMRIDKEWYVDEIRRESILFKRTSDRKFVSIPLSSPKKARFHRGWSFYGQPMALWEAVELLAHGFGYNAVMHFQAGGAVVPGDHGGTISKLLLKVMPPHHRFALAGPVLQVLPVKPAGENWTDVLSRMKLLIPERLALRYPGLNKAGIIHSRGDDIQFVLRKISLGGKTPISFPKDLHFPVYATFRHIPFYQMLAKIVYINQCIIIEREEGLEVTPWPRQILQRRPYPDYPLIKSGPLEPQAGTGPRPPVQMPNHQYSHPIVKQSGTNSQTSF